MSNSNPMPEFYRTPMTAHELMQHIAAAKKEHSKVLAARPFAEKLRSLERMRERAKLFRNSRIVDRSSKSRP
jgi:hypothetical protein